MFATSDQYVCFSMSIFGIIPKVKIFQKVQYSNLCPCAAEQMELCLKNTWSVNSEETFSNGVARKQMAFTC